MDAVALIPKRSQPEALALAARMAGWLLERGKAVFCEEAFPVDGAQPVPSSELPHKAGVLVVLGGDGTLLHAARLCAGVEVPILGINMGTLGFMTEVPREDAFAALERVVAGDFAVERRTKLAVRVEREGRTILAGEVLNDCVINKNALARIADIEASVDGARLTTFKADGIIVATPTGSSAYSLAAGGPLVQPSVKAMLVVPICPHTLTQRPVVLPEESEVELVLHTDGEMFVTLDGQSGRDLARGDRVIVRRATTSTLLVRHDPSGYFAVLRDKLLWGER